MSLELIASENYTSRGVMDAMGSILTNKYSEGLPGKRYYGGNQCIDKIEELCIQRCLEAFNLDPREWGCNVQPYSGSIANFATLTALLKPNDRLMGLDLPSGGHLTHGYQTSKSKISSTSIYFQSMPYQVDPDTGLMDYNTLEKNAKLFRPNLIICGGSAYPRDWDYSRFRQIANQHGAYLMMDMAHIAGLVSTGISNNPFDHCDVVTTTTHKTIRGPRSGVIFFRKHLEDKINFSVFPSCQGGPHNHQISAVAVAMKQMKSKEFKDYINQVVSNAKILCSRLTELGYVIMTGGTDNHSLLWNLKPHGLTGSKMEKITDVCGISINKNTIVSDVSAVSPSGVRLGTSSLTTRGFTSSDVSKVADILDECVCLALYIQSKSPTKKLVDFEKTMVEFGDEINLIRNTVSELALKFDVPN
jgi:glycine hydroxymethyltransferase